MLFFLVIVVVPFALLLIAFFRADLIEQLIQEPSARQPIHQPSPVAQPDQTLPP